jgi:activating signal cointegrator 1
MKTLSLLQPWASLVVSGIKRIETRSWSTRYRGPLLIHASQGKTGGLVVQQPPFYKYIQDFNELPFGSIIGKVWLQSVLRMDQLFLRPEEINRLSVEERAFGDYSGNRYAWILEQPVRFSLPTPVRGSLNLWEFPEERLVSKE